MEKSPSSEHAQHKARLREYYKLKSAKSVENVAQQETQDDIDLATFDVKKYTAHSSSNLPSLLKNTNELISDLKIFESSKKSLIYNNYTSLIGASDTVSRMRIELDGLEKELDALEQIANAISNDLSIINQRHTVKEGSADMINPPT